MASTRPLTSASLLIAPAPAASAGCLDAQDVAGLEVAGRLRRQLLAVQEVASHCARVAAALAARRNGASLGQQRQPAGLECLELADDAVAAAAPARTARAVAYLVAADAQRVRELERLDRRVERVRHGDVDGRRPVSLGARALPAGDRLVVRKPVVSEDDVVHRALALGGNRHGAAEGAE